MRVGAVRFDFATFIAESRCVALAEDDGLADVFERSPVLSEKLVHGQSMSVPSEDSVMTHGRSPAFVLPSFCLRSASLSAC